ncbi:hypothetical protein [Tepidibacillus marianensis]|uniref:hypothetical protein n=1 Tax=Tepidibacillus marianensis TaxID=3131995 RepID=UPI0030CDB625
MNKGAINVSIQLNVLSGEINPTKMNPIKNNLSALKPSGGLWTSSYDPFIGSDWVQYSFQVGGFRVPDNETWDGYLLYPNKDVRIYTIDSYKDLESLMKQYRVKSKLKFPNFYARRVNYSIDFEKISQEYDAIHLTKKGHLLTKKSYPYNLDGWDVESTIWFRWVFDKTVPVQEAFVREKEIIAI